MKYEGEMSAELTTHTFLVIFFSSFKKPFMAAETKTSTHRVDTTLSESLKKKFLRHCKKLNVSVAQRLRDLIQQDLKK
jgi:hypothetical protein